MLDNPIAVRILFYESLGIDEEVNGMIHKAFDLFGAYTQAYLENGKGKGFLRPDLHTREAALAVNSMLLEAARRIVTAPDAGRGQEGLDKYHHSLDAGRSEVRLMS